MAPIARALNASCRSIDNWQRQRKIPFIRISPRCVRFHLPSVLAALEEHLPWLLRTSPPTSCKGLIETIAEVRGVAPQSILPGAGSSDLIFRALRHWLTPRSKTLILDPTYGEYVHVLEHVIGCTVDRLPLLRSKGYAVELPRLEGLLSEGHH